MKNLKNRLLLGLSTIILITFTNCTNNDDDLPEVDITNVKLSSDATLGNILVDADGKSLYFFSKDTKEISNCNDGCLDAWPIFYNAIINAGTGLDADDFSTITRADGSKQTTYKNWPLYYFTNDSNAGDTNGEAVGGVWFVAKPDYSIMYANAQLVGNDGKNYLGDYTEGDATTSYFVSIAGRTMYSFKNDTNNTNNFTVSDFSNNESWPIVEITLDQIPSTLDSAGFDTIDVFGRTQLTYKGWPLYYFGGDTLRGDNKGVSVPSPGVWPIVNKNITAAQ
jgi:predicted lipoprotein with Yx(FWY)xxD motif